MSEPRDNSSNNNNGENNNGKDVRLLLLAETSADGGARARAPLQKIFIDDLTKAGGPKRQRVWRVPWFILLMCFMQCFIGMCLELEQGHWRLAAVYLAGGLAGALANAWLQPHLLLLGASAGVYAMLFSHVPHLVLNFPHLSHRFARIAALLILFLSDVAFTAFHFRQNHNRNPRISLEAHLGGGVAGLLCGFVVYRRVQKSIYL
ncbi:GL19515 [Drosophila persimilis]|uniref:GL19515 n=1 Tax=Drosophila persimilis TaxID=7234 RepID=B4G9N8_DROPE|nr:GL19515 [Drosophila persimilis]